MARDILLLDPSVGAEGRLPTLLKLASQKFDWRITQPPGFTPDMNGEAWLSDLRSMVKQAEIIVCFGNFLALLQGTDDIPVLIREAIDDGSPALFDYCSSLTNESFREKVDVIADVLLGSFGVHLTTTKVVARKPQFQDHASPSCCAFRKADDSLLDPELFDGVTQIVGIGSKLIEYDPDVFPLVEANSRHFFVDRQDLCSAGTLGQRNAVAVRLNRGKTSLIALSGKFLADSSDTAFGRVPGISENGRFADNLLGFLESRAGQKPGYVKTIFDLFEELEITLGRMIQKVLASHSATGAFADLIPPKIREQLTQGGKVEYSSATYIHLIRILKEQWQIFEPLFQAPKDDVLSIMFDINQGQRVFLAHPHKRSQLHKQFGPEDERTVQQALQLVRQAARASATFA